MSSIGSSLPSILAEIADVAGAEAAWALARTQGGTTIYIPREAEDDHWLTELVGKEAASKICNHFRVGNTGARIPIPLAKQSEQRVRLQKALEAGMSAPQAARAAGMHERSAFRARARMKDNDEIDDQQGKLF
ncbi:helix-turn-helix domain-containing protein [Nitratireductor aquimarinus]|uniref:helix-turn-helix domain-containing protein n=1 Tax=Nitratireductor aquimarinus TaxID=889300 RepID=UPI001A9055CE|nr:helix-turn-helix domain-containing protein [Nitratireductor aquimarinus]MBN8243290.1 helix-turn-helix domain-containing protein [Nitratireductor aquimarinus]MBY6131191.1 helix-turn-helix domain-containing protein [Nitratireductor aquimarinus]MCA1302053.1 helix-turn-helix domain-containing protein [Nitratireductor aquimarinus]